jgi:hypothetical protein
LVKTTTSHIPKARIIKKLQQRAFYKLVKATTLNTKKARKSRI